MWSREGWRCIKQHDTSQVLLDALIMRGVLPDLALDLERVGCVLPRLTLQLLTQLGLCHPLHSATSPACAPARAGGGGTRQRSGQGRKNACRP